MSENPYENMLTFIEKHSCCDTSDRFTQFLLSLAYESVKVSLNESLIGLDSDSRRWVKGAFARYVDRPNGDEEIYSVAKRLKALQPELFDSLRNS